MNNKLEKLIERLGAARRSGVPIISLNTPDPAASVRLMAKAFEVKTEKVEITKFPCVQWDTVRGLFGLNDKGWSFVAEICGGWAPGSGPRAEQPKDLNQDPVGITGSLVECLSQCLKLPTYSVLFIHAAHRFIELDGVVQSIWNIRDVFKQNMRLLVLMSPGMQLPADLQNDVISFEEPLPDSESLGLIVDEAYSYVSLPAPDPNTRSQAIAALTGLSAFCAEQVSTMSIRKTGLDLEDLTERKRRAVEQTQGLRIYRGPETFADVRGVDNITGYLKSLMKGKDPAQCVVFIDEIDKSIGGARGDTSGVSADQVGVVLSYMADNEVDGILEVGVPGAGKSLVAKAFANEAGKPCVIFDLAGMKDSLVGSSERNIRNALRVVDAISGGRPIFIATCNKVKLLPPELRSRFSLGTFFFPLPTKDERENLWRYFLNKYQLVSPDAKDALLPADDNGWTGREIRDCCRIAWKLGCSPAEAAPMIVPVAISAKDEITQLCREADGAFISASCPGPYRYMDQVANEVASSAAPRKPGRQVLN
jgi:hypothetical protein